MKASATTALNLPQKIIVFQEEEGVKIAYNNPAFLERRDLISNKNDALEKTMSVLDLLDNSDLNASRLFTNCRFF